MPSLSLISTWCIVVCICCFAFADGKTVSDSVLHFLFACNEKVKSNFNLDPEYRHQKRNIEATSYVTNQWAIKLAPGADPVKIAEKHGHNYIGKVNVSS